MLAPVEKYLGVVAILVDVDDDVGASPAYPRIISERRRYRVKPMTAEEAALALSDEDDQFLVFRDADTNRIGVLYKRKDGNYGLIEP